jgi:hypothetical protein
VSAAAALEAIRRLAGRRQVRFTLHALDRMDERGVRRVDVTHALTSAKACRAQGDGKWKVTGGDLDGDELTVIVVIEADAIVVTVY